MLLGFDIGGTKCAIVLGKKENGALHITAKKVIPTGGPAYEMIDKLFSAAAILLEENTSAINTIEGIGISCGGPLSRRRGLILSPPNLPGWDNIPMVELAEKRFGKKVMMQNDANAGAMAEWKYCAGKGCNNVIFLTFGTGMGAGLILDGRLYEGSSELAGEVGHMRLAEIGPVGFGKAGSFEGFCSGGGIAQIAQMKVRQKLQMGEPVTFCNSLEQLPGLTAKTVAEAAFAGDELAIDIYNLCAAYLGKGLSLLIDVLNPERIILGSIYGRTKTLLDPVMNAVIAAEALAGASNVCEIVPTALGESIGDIAALTLAEMCAA